MTWALDGWIIITGVLCALACALVGNYLVLRRMSMMGDAISHAVLPGLAAAFILTGSRTSIAMFIGAVVVGVLTALLTQWVHRFGKVEEGASMGVVFTALFAVGLILIQFGARHVDLDPGCVLYGAVEYAPLDLVAVGAFMIPRAVVQLGAVLLLNAMVVILFYKELKLSAFDPELATSLGINATAMHYLLMTLVAITTVASFEAVGSILVVAMLIVPGAAAWLLTERLGRMIGVSLLIAGVSAVLGHLGAVYLPRLFGLNATTTAGMMAVMTGVLFGLALLFSPKQGIVSRLVDRISVASQIAMQDMLATLWRHEERAGGVVTVGPGELLHDQRPSALIRRLALRRLLRSGQIKPTRTGYTFSDAGRDAARDLVRSHRLWESYLDRHLPLPTDHLHASAERLEHVTDASMRSDLDRATDSPRTDPQGKQIP